MLLRLRPVNVPNETESVHELLRPILRRTKHTFDQVLHILPHQKARYEAKSESSTAVVHVFLKHWSEEYEGVFENAV